MASLASLRFAPEILRRLGEELIPHADQGIVDGGPLDDGRRFVAGGIPPGLRAGGVVGGALALGRISHAPSSGPGSYGQKRPTISLES